MSNSIHSRLCLSNAVRMAKDGAIVIDGKDVEVKASGDVKIKGSKVGDN